MLQYRDQQFSYKAQRVEHEISQIKLTMLNTTCHTKYQTSPINFSPLNIKFLTRSHQA